MARTNMTQRVDALEHAADPRLSNGVLIVMSLDEPEEMARSRWESAHGPLDPRIPILWVETGVPRAVHDS